jgi:hypothetical protein
MPELKQQQPDFSHSGWSKDGARLSLIDLCQWLWEEFRVHIARQTLSRELRNLGYRKLTARPRHHAQAAGAIEHFKTYGPPRPQAVLAI